MLGTKFRIVLCGSGTGGHIFPLTVVAKEIDKRLEGQVEFLYIGADGPFERTAMQAAGIQTQFIQTGKWRRYFSILNFTDIFRVLYGFIQALVFMYRYMPDVVFSKGGSAAVPVVIAAKLYGIPVLTHESDAVPGVANRIVGKLADRVAVGYSMAKGYFASAKVAQTGTPVRPEIVAGDAVRARATFRLPEGRPLLLVLGGSQGARSINRIFSRIAPKLVNYFEVVHQTGEKNFEETKQWIDEAQLGENAPHYHLVPFIQGADLGDLLAAADTIVARAGASQIADIAARSSAALILVPLSSAANDHQRMNAYEVARLGGALVLEETNLGENILLNNIVRLSQDRALHDQMAKALKPFYHPDAEESIAAGVVGLLER